MTEDRTKLQWPELATAIRAAREARGLSQVALAELAGVSEGTVQNLEDDGQRRSRIPPSLAKVEPHLGWTPGSGHDILRGGQPTPATPPADAPPQSGKARDRLRDRLPLRIVDELESDDDLIDSQVIELPGTDGARMTVVVHGRAAATPEQIQEALLAWRRAERNLRRPSGEGDAEPPESVNGS
ncbi:MULTISPECIES: helix-turn-helix transcriptional regulator [unclassified Streptomyces]|uniref:helix-turn-helix domain-containing protein n=1 Tax=unclassified Streptomyces TaxID=2593676 RepID=UPI00278C6CAF|nr:MULTISPECIES: helix-turn-helix transcriptional regulator [unclassified Streptomyces]